MRIGMPGSVVTRVLLSFRSWSRDPAALRRRGRGKPRRAHQSSGYCPRVPPRDEVGGVIRTSARPYERRAIRCRMRPGTRAVGRSGRIVRTLGRNPGRVCRAAGARDLRRRRALHSRTLECRKKTRFPITTGARGFPRRRCPHLVPSSRDRRAACRRSADETPAERNGGRRVAPAPT